MINVNKLTFFPPLTTGCYSANFTNLKIFGFATDGRRKHRENSEVRSVFSLPRFFFSYAMLQLASFSSLGAGSFATRYFVGSEKPKKPVVVLALYSM